MVGMGGTEVDEDEKKQALCRRVDRAIAAVSVLHDGRADLRRLLLAHPHHAQRLLDEARYLGENEARVYSQSGRSCQSVTWQGVRFTYDSNQRHLLVGAEAVGGVAEEELGASMLSRFA
jgi:hypothetical protein